MGIDIEMGHIHSCFITEYFIIKSVQEVSQREKIEKLATDLEKANVRLTELDRQKSKVVSFATHQLRAPLTAIKGYSSMILEGDIGILPKEAHEGVSAYSIRLTPSLSR